MSIRIIVADDEPITRMDIAEMLKEVGCNVVGKAADGFDAVELCKKNKPDVVLLDIKMPLLDGLMAAKMIRENNMAKAVVLLSAYSGQEFVEKAKNSGALAYLVKPIMKESLLPTVELALHRANEIETIKKEHMQTKEKLESRTIINRAKGLLMQTKDISEEEAYGYIKKMSRIKGCAMKDIAQVILIQEKDELQDD
ncbi:response regulator receiver and ANTAR domain protein [Natranaerovirga hydrolytica]|uniref:Stage 0 sporulation protein A homolog n=1 Tax=Natranaerovirga hydrolytica TaxID=680378 RepID=A0A4R1N402_9FIRM|nr:response regulator [Natranaerovirga hydrolytica]TCK98804.1 response regulator receiver and ANTAR domain protein [Natranaerovirga hydrolytica]